MTSMTNKYVISIPAFKVKQPIGEFFVSSMNAKDLVDISYSDVRRIENRDIERYLGIQRPLKESRVKEIRSYILNSKDASFPTSIILSIDEKCAEYDDRTQTLHLYPYKSEDNPDESIPIKRIAKVLDGQHRIAGFIGEKKECLEFDFHPEFEVNVSIFIGIDIPEQAKIFATVNLAQTKVNKSLVYDLEALARGRNPFKTCHHVAVALDQNSDSPLHKRIKRLGVATPGRKSEPLTQASFVESLVKIITDDPIRDRNFLLDNKKIPLINQEKHPFNIFFREGVKGDLKIYEIIYNYFSAVRDRWPNSWENTSTTGNLLPKSNAFKALVRYLHKDVYPEIINGNYGYVPSISEFSPFFAHVELEDNDFTTRNFLPGSGGEAAFYKVLTGALTPEEFFIIEN